MKHPCSCIAYLCGFVIASFGCGDKDKNSNDNPYTPGGLCAAANPPAECALSCGSVANPYCPTGFYCTTDNSQRCTADCVFGDDSACGGKKCNTSGQCVDPVVGGNTGNGQQCGTLVAKSKLIELHASLLVDTSGSMNYKLQADGGNASNSCNDLSRWSVLRNFLIGTGCTGSGTVTPAGPESKSLLKDLEGVVTYNAAFYTSNASDTVAYDKNKEMNNATCLELTPNPLPSTPQTLKQVTDVYPLEGDGLTPTALALSKAKDQLVPRITADKKQIVILVTDGAPNNCRFPEPDSGDDNDKNGIEDKAELRSQVIDVAAGMKLSGIPVYVVGVSVKPDLAAHLRDVAKAGTGSSTNFFSIGANPDAGSYDAIKAEFDKIILPSLSCEFELTNGKIETGRECDGTVSIDYANGSKTPVVCDPTNGYSAPSSSDGQRRIRLNGTSCKTLQDAIKAKKKPTLNATFPCGAYIVS